MFLDGTIVYYYCQWRLVSISGLLLVFCRSFSLITWKYYTSVNSHLSDCASRALTNAGNEPRNATGHGVGSFSHLPPLPSVLSPFLPPSFIHLSTSHPLSCSILFHTQFYSPVTLITCCSRHVLFVILFFLSRSFSEGYLGDF